MPLYVWLLVFHPILITLLALVALALFFHWTGWWARYKYRILLALLAAYVIDAAFALPRIAFAYSLPKGPSIEQQVPLPSRLVLVGVRCDAKCHNSLISGAVDEIISVTPRYPGHTDVATAVSYRVGWTEPGACPRERERAIWLGGAAQQQSGYCPMVEPVDIPKQGVFAVHDGTIVTAREPARAYTPTYLVKAPPGPVIRFFGVEIQNRDSAGISVLASAYRYEAPGLLGLPPLIGCWDRPDNVLWIMPPGDTGCGLWRWFTWGGDDRAVNDERWIFDQAFGPPDRAVRAPKLPDLLPATPAQALEILSRGDIEFYLPRLREALLDPANSNDALTNLMVRIARRGILDGALMALLATNRPAVLANLSDRLVSFPKVFTNPGPVLDEMELNAKFRDDFADAMFLFLKARWERSDNVSRFLGLMEASHPGWLCNQLARHKGSADLSSILANDVVKRNSTQCNF
jgi:hypothetical protein